MKTGRAINWPFLLLVFLVVTALFGFAVYRMDIDTDIVGAMPTNDPVISDSAYIFRNHPLQSRVIVDIALDRNDPDTLVECGKRVEKRFKDSGLFKDVGMDEFQKLIPDLLNYILANMPIFFTEKELKTYIQPLLEPEEISRRLKEDHTALLSIESIGQAEFISNDPLNFREIVLSRLASLVPSGNTRIYRGNILSIDGRHLLLTAQPLSSGTDTNSARMITALIKRLSSELQRDYGERGYRVDLTPLGAYRAALDNEKIIRKDVTFAMLFATLGIAILLVFAFPRPLIGLFSFLPAIAGTMLAFFVYSLFHPSISIMVLGFGGAIISITVDHGIAYLLFLDRPGETSAREASEEVWAIGLLAMLTSVGAFGILSFSGFPVFVQLGQFAALGIGLSFLFVHLIFPKVLIALPFGHRRFLPIQPLVDALAGAGRKGAWAALGFAVVMAFFAKPVFDVSMQSMNTVSAETLSAEKMITRVWGNVFDKVYLMIEGQSVQDLQDQGDEILDRLDRDISTGILSTGFVPSALFPGNQRRQSNFTAWKNFWDIEKIGKIRSAMADTGASLGFAADAFDPFFDVLSTASYTPRSIGIPAAYFGFLGISQNPADSKWLQVSTLAPGPDYDAAHFRNEYVSSGKLFDPAYFSERLGSLLFDTFSKLLALVALSVVVLLAFFFLDIKLTLAALLPVLFALISTLGTLKIIGHPIDIPGLMLAIVVLGMGIDYSLFFVRSYQRYGVVKHPLFGLIRMAVFMASASTLIGFGVLCSAQHSLLRSAGLTSFLGIGYSLLGAFLILPPLLEYIHSSRGEIKPGSGSQKERVLNRYRHMEAYPRLFARFKIRFDPMFLEMKEIFKPAAGVRTIIDLGSGYGVPASWLLERFPKAFLYGIEPSRKRVKVAARAIGNRGIITTGSAPDVPVVRRPADLALMLDMVHYLDDKELKQTLQGLREQMKDQGHLVLRAAVEPKRKFPWLWWLENLKLRLHKVPFHYRTLAQLESMMTQAGFTIEFIRPSGAHQELFWFSGKVTSGRPADPGIDDLGT